LAGRGNDPGCIQFTGPFAFFLRFFAFFAFQLFVVGIQHELWPFVVRKEKGKRKKRKDPQKERK
jgi:hypothetical protein